MSRKAKDKEKTFANVVVDEGRAITAHRCHHWLSQQSTPLCCSLHCSCILHSALPPLSVAVEYGSVVHSSSRDILHQGPKSGWPPVPSGRRSATGCFNRGAPKSLDIPADNRKRGIRQNCLQEMRGQGPVTCIRCLSHARPAGALHHLQARVLIRACEEVRITRVVPGEM